MQSPFFAALISLCLFESAALPGGAVRRVSLFGYQVGSRVLKLDEAAAAAAQADERASLEAACARHASGLDPRVVDGLREDIDAGLLALPGADTQDTPDAQATPAGRPALVRLEQPTAEPAPLERRVELDPDESSLFTEQYDVPGLEVAVDDAAAPELVAAANDVDEPPAGAPCACGGLEGGHPCEVCAGAYATQVDATTFDDEEPLLDEDLPEARATLCTLCDAGRRRTRGECSRCLNRRVRVWVGAIEVFRTPPRTELGRLAACYALADLLPKIPDAALQGARELLNVALGGAEPDTRTKALRQWMFASQHLAALS